MKERLQATDDQIVTVRNGMDFTGYAPATRPPSVPVIGYLARLCYGKGLRTLVEAVAKLAPRLPEARLALAGPTTAADALFIASQNATLAQAGLTGPVTLQNALM